MTNDDLERAALLAAKDTRDAIARAERAEARIAQFESKDARLARVNELENECARLDAQLIVARVGRKEAEASLTEIAKVVAWAQSDGWTIRDAAAAVCTERDAYIAAHDTALATIATMQAQIDGLRARPGDARWTGNEAGAWLCAQCSAAPGACACASGRKWVTSTAVPPDPLGVIGGGGPFHGPSINPTCPACNTEDHPEHGCAGAAEGRAECLPSLHLAPLRTATPADVADIRANMVPSQAKVIEKIVAMEPDVVEARARVLTRMAEEQAAKVRAEIRDAFHRRWGRFMKCSCGRPLGDPQSFTICREHPRMEGRSIAGYAPPPEAP